MYNYDLATDALITAKLFSVRESSSLWIGYIVFIVLAHMAPTLVLHLRLVSLASTHSSTSNSGMICNYAAQFASLRPYVWMAAVVGCGGIRGQLLQLIFPWLSYLFLIDYPMMWWSALTRRKVPADSAVVTDHQQQQGSSSEPQSWTAKAFPWLHLVNYLSLHSFCAVILEDLPVTAITTWVYLAGASPERPIVINTWLFYISVLPALGNTAFLFFNCSEPWWFQGRV